MAKPLIYITRKVPEKLLAPYRQKYIIKPWEKEDEVVPKEILFQEAKEADALLSVISDKIDKELFDVTPNLKVVANLAVGYDNIDLDTAKQKNVIVTNTPDVLTETTADLAFALLMATARRVVEANDFIKNDQWKEWAPYLLAGTDIHHKTIGIIGMGRIGEAIARRATGFGMEILYHNRSRNYAAEKELQATYLNFDGLLDKADFVVSVVPLTKETTKLFDDVAFRKMKSTAIFINISRGGVVDEEALLKALQTKQIKAAGLDVFNEEPIGTEHPLVHLNNVVCLPHIGSASSETRSKMLQLCLENIEGVLDGSGPKTPVI